MKISLPTRGPFDGDIYARIIEALRLQGYIVLTEVFALEQLQTLLIAIKTTDSAEFQAAGIGREQGHRINQFIRRDRIHWLGESDKEAGFYLDWIEQLRLRLNRELFLGLFDYECHYAHYPKGAFYKKHYDSFQGSSNRRLSTVLYLNPAWQHDDGGELIMYDSETGARLETVAPSFGTMVMFLSEELPHEVLPTRKSRYSLTGWFRINTNTGVNLDPPV